MRPAWSAAAGERRYNRYPRLAESGEGWVVSRRRRASKPLTILPSEREREREGERGRAGGCCLDSAADKFRVVVDTSSTYEQKGQRSEVGIPSQSIPRRS